MSDPILAIHHRNFARSIGGATTEPWSKALQGVCLIVRKDAGGHSLRRQILSCSSVGSSN